MTIDKTTGQTEETTTHTNENTKTTAMNAAHWAQMLGDCTLGETIELEGLQIFPLHRAQTDQPEATEESATHDAEAGASSCRQQKTYTLADDLLAKKQAEIREVDENGVVSDLIFDNHADKHALLLDGIELRGCKQNRMVNTTILATAGEKTTVDVSCVEAGRWRHEGETFSHSGRTVGATLRNRKAHMVHGGPVAQEQHRARTNQSAVWNEVDEYIQIHGAESATSALDDVYQSVAREEAMAAEVPPRAAARKEVETRLEKIQATGAIVALGNRIIGLDLFADSDTFNGFWKSVADGYALDARSHRRSTTEARSPGDKPDADHETGSDRAETTVSREQVEAWASFLRTGIKLAPRELAGSGEHFSLQGPGVAGGLVLLEGELVHAALFPVLN